MNNLIGNYLGDLKLCWNIILFYFVELIFGLKEIKDCFVFWLDRRYLGKKDNKNC